jgi:DNA modification methylase
MSLTFRTFLGDCLDVIPTLPESSVDLVLCDLPYGTTACKWDTIIPLAPLWDAWERVIKPGAPIVLTCAQPFTTVLAASKLDWLRYEWIWEKPQGTNPLNAKVMPLRAHENILVFYKNRGVYNPQMTAGTPIPGFSSDDATIGEVYGNRKSVHRENPGTRYPRSVLRFAQERKGHHPTQKPVPLMEYFIRTYTNPGDTVLDNCMGSGTTGVACVNTGRNFIGIEMLQTYFDIAKARIAAAEAELVPEAALF